MRMGLPSKSMAAVSFMWENRRSRFSGTAGGEISDNIKKNIEI